MRERGRLLRGEVDAPGQQRLVVLDARCLWQRGEQRTQVPVGFDTIGLGGFDQGVQVGAGGRTADGVGEQPVAPADDEGADRILASIMPRPELCRLARLGTDCQAVSRPTNVRDAA